MADREIAIGVDSDRPTAGRVVVVGAGIGGLSSALALGRAGHAVILLERDPLPTTGDVEEAFDADRRGAPQVHQTHGFLARLVVELRQHFPDVLQALRDVGCVTMPAQNNLGDPQPGDEDLAVLIVRRTTLEWLLREAVLAEPNIDVRPGVGVSGLLPGPDPTAATLGIPSVGGVRLDDGTWLTADVVIDACGRRSPMPEWLHDMGVDVPETIHESGLMYLSRWYRVPPSLDVPLDAKLGGDLGYLKFLAVPGDARTLSITLAIRTHDSELRAALSDPKGFEQACRMLEGPARYFAGGPLEPIGGVRPMTGLLNRVRRFVDDDGRPTVLGFHAIGDSHTCTNPLYGRGCSLALVQALSVAQEIAAHPGDPVGRAVAVEAASVRQIEPWYHSSVEMDIAGADPGIEPGAPEREPSPMARVFVAAETDPVIGRALTKMMNLLATPAELAGDAEFSARVAEIFADPASYPVPPRVGPSRVDLLGALLEQPRQSA
jgi:2-polyprenyl-6-methoxyphenol hydroxylase-like FAD-dependent oxidoreductase